jgi:hypothetical protein
MPDIDHACLPDSWCQFLAYRYGKGKSLPSLLQSYDAVSSSPCFGAGSAHQLISSSSMKAGKEEGGSSLISYEYPIEYRAYLLSKSQVEYPCTYTPACTA